MGTYAIYPGPIPLLGYFSKIPDYSYQNASSNRITGSSAGKLEIEAMDL